MLAAICRGNPIHEDLIYAARAAELAFICNVVINAKHEIVSTFTCDCEQAHIAGTEFLKGLCCCSKVISEIVISTNNGYPLDQSVYQAVKGMTAAEATCREGGVIIMAAACNDGHGGESFMRTIASDKSAAEILAEIQATPKVNTVPDQWESQILARILSKFHVVLISEANPALVSAMKMRPAKDISETLSIAETLLGHKGSITVFLEGISTIIT